MHSVVLLHHPILNKHGSVVTTAVTNMDLHDLSRTATTYGAKHLYVVTPVEHQHELLGRILDHWKTPRSAQAHPDRVEALSRIVLVKSFEAVLERFGQDHGLADTTLKPAVVMTDARDLSVESKKKVSYAGLKAALDGAPMLLVFGTGWGVAPEFFGKVDLFLDPVFGYGGKGSPGHYNHLSVRAAAAAVMDRLFGDGRFLQ